MKTILTALIILVVILLLRIDRYEKQEVELMKYDIEHMSSDTTAVVIEHDTIIITQPEYIMKYITHIDTIFANIVSDNLDTDGKDSVLVEIPIEQRHYTGDEYDAYISGYCPTLDSLFIHNIRETVTITNDIKHKRNRWGIGVTAGYGLTPNGLAPALSVGVTYNLFDF